MKTIQEGALSWLIQCKAFYGGYPASETHVQKFIVDFANFLDKSYTLTPKQGQVVDPTKLKRTSVEGWANDVCRKIKDQVEDNVCKDGENRMEQGRMEITERKSDIDEALCKFYGCAAGPLKIGDIELDCYVLKDGTPIIKRIYVYIWVIIQKLLRSIWATEKVSLGRCDYKATNRSRWSELNKK